MEILTHEVTAEFYRIRAEKAQSIADRRLELLREIDEKCAFCPMCMSHKISTVGEKIHRDNCKLAKELEA